MAKSRTSTHTSAAIAPRESFFRFILKKEQLYQLLFIFLFYLAAYYLMTSLWPYPRATDDSANYIKAAIRNGYDGIRPFGYSSFLVSLHKISPTMWFIVFAQYWINFLFTTFFVFTVKYFFRPKSRTIEVLFTTFSVASVMVIFLTNSILSDSIFSSLTMCWATLGIWFIGSQHIPTKALTFLLHVFVMGFLINIRYTGFAYAGVTFLMLVVVFFRKNRGIGVGLALVLCFISYTFYNNQCKATNEVTGIESFGGFGGWQKASNALYIWPHVKLNENEIEDPEIKDLVLFLKDHDSTIVARTSRSINPELMWIKTSPLREYFHAFKKKNKFQHSYAWTYLGTHTYNNFGSMLVWKYPMAYFKHFLWPNFMYTLYPKMDLVYIFYKPNAIPGVLLKQWFNMSEKTVSNPGHSSIVTIGKYLPMVRLIIWLLTFLAMVFYLIRSKRSGWRPQQRAIFWFLALFVLVYLGFHALNVPFELRYLAPLHVMQIGIIYLVVNTFIPLRKKAGAPETK